MATLNDFGIPGIASGTLQPMLKHKFRVTFANLGGGVNSIPVSHQVVNVTTPTFNWNEVEVHRYNTTAYVPGKHVFEPITLTIEDDVASTASRVLQEQVQIQQFLTGSEGSFLATAQEGSALKFGMIIDSMDGNELVLKKWLCEGCWIQNYETGEYDYTSTGEARTITMTIRYDHAREDFLNYTPGLGSALGGHI